MTKQRRAIGTDDLGSVSHVKEYMRVIEWWQFANAHELPRADIDHRDAGSIVEVWNDGIRHVVGGAFAGGFEVPISCAASSYRNFKSRPCLTGAATESAPASLLYGVRAVGERSIASGATYF
jgi:hypothetical protein